MTAGRAERLVRHLMGDVAQAVSRFRADSDLSRVNAAAGRMVPVRPLTLTLVDVALRAARRTGGACDPTVGRQLLGLGYDVDISELRRSGEVALGPPAGPADWTAVGVDHELGRVGVPARLGLDLGATAKAWTADEAASRLATALGVPVLVAVGGDVAAAGERASWPVLVGEDEGGPGDVLELRRGGIATSSTRGRRWTTTAGGAHHVLDPRTGAPVTGPYRTASVVAGSCVEANTLSTAALVWGAGAVGRLAPHPARLVESGGRVVTTGAWPRPEVAA